MIAPFMGNSENMPRKSIDLSKAPPETTTVCIMKPADPQGFNIHPYFCTVNPSGYLTAKGRISEDEQLDPEKGQDVGSQIAALANSIEMQTLVKRFAPVKSKPGSFLKDIDKDYMKSVVMPFIDNTLSEIIKLIIANNIQVYMHETLPNLYENEQVVIEPIPARARLNFTRTDEGTSYTLSAFMGNKQIDLLQPGNAIITRDPCLLLHEKHLLFFDSEIDGNLLSPFLKKQSIEIPKRIEKDYFGKFIRKLVNRCEIEADGFKVETIKPEPEAEITPDIDWQGKPVLILSFAYGDKSIQPNNPNKSITSMFADKDGFVFSRLKRELAWEKEMQKKLKSFGLAQSAATYKLPTENSSSFLALIDWLIIHQSDLAEAGFKISQHPERGFILAKSTVRTNIRSTNDWFDLNAVVEAGNYSFPFFRLRENILNGDREYVLPSGEIFLIPEPWMTEYTELMMFAEGIGDKPRIRKHHFMLLKPFQFPEAEELAAIVHPNISSPLPELHNVTLRPYQEYGYRRISNLFSKNFGSILADDMGLGKTLQAIALLADLYPQTDEIQIPESNQDKESGPGLQLDIFSALAPASDILHSETKAFPAVSKTASLIVMPASLIHNWYYELKRFAPWIRIHTYTGPNRKINQPMLKRANVILTTYGTLRNDIEKLETYNFTVAILDESQQIKNPASSTAKAAFRIKCKNRLAMSGTPVENSLADLWSQMQYVNPGMLGSLKTFQTEYVNPSRKHIRQDATEKLKLMIAPFVIRRTKAEVAPELPPVSESIAWCTMTDQQQKIYETEKSGIRNTLLSQLASGEQNMNATLVLKALMKLRQIACHPTLAGDENNIGSGKFEDATEKLETLIAENHKVLIFSSFVKHLDLYENWCQEHDIKYSKLIGSTSNREEVVNTFKEGDDVQVFLISLKAGGVGLNLQEAGYVFLLDPWWNPAAESQAISRSHRIGQDKNVFVYRFISTGTVEEKIIRLQDKKRKLADSVIQSEEFLAKLSTEEISELFE
jgi:superfamily II DNA or RNA helicase